MTIEKTMPPGEARYVKIPRELEAKAYVWPEYAKGAESEGEEGEAPHTGTLEPAPHPGDDPVEVGFDGSGRRRPESRRPFLSVADQVLELVLVVDVAGESPAVDIQITTGDDGMASMGGERADPFLADHINPLRTRRRARGVPCMLRPRRRDGPGAGLSCRW